MSAIVGIIDWRGAPVAADIVKALAALQPMGRDGQGMWDGGDVALGFRQTILHLEDDADRQPVAGGEGRYRLVFDGRLDNRDELAVILSLPPELARTWPDSRYVLSAFEKWGEQCPAHLLGDFAFAVWDCRERTLFLARDCLSVKPLFYWSGPHGFAFASSVEAVLAMPGVSRELNKRALFDRASMRRALAETTFFRDVAQLRGGFVLVARAGAQTCRAYWDVRNTPDIRYKDEREYPLHFRTIIEDATRQRLRSVHPIGCHLSSGFDSSSILALAANSLRTQNLGLRAFTAAPPTGWSPRAIREDRIDDESDLAVLTARSFPNVEHRIIHSPEYWDFAALDHYARAFSMPRPDDQNAGWYHLLHTTARSDGVRVMLCGGAGNRAMSYDGADIFGTLLRQGKLRALAGELDSAHRAGMSWRHLLRCSLAPFIPDLAWDWLLRTLGQRGTNTIAQCMVNPHFVSANRIDWRSSKCEVGPSNWHRATRRQMISHFTHGSRDFFHAGTLAAWDLEIRDPTSDRRVFEFCYAIPWQQFFKDGRGRRLIRRALADIVPPAVFAETRRGRQGAHWYDAAAVSMSEINSELDAFASVPLAAEILDIPRIREQLGRWNTQYIAGHGLSHSRYERVLNAVAVGRFIRMELAG